MFRRRNHQFSRQSRKFIERRQTRVMAVIGLSLISAVTWTYISANILNSSFFAINDIQVRGATHEVSSTAESASWKAIDGKYLRLFSKSSSPIFPRESLIASVLQASASIDSVSVTKESLHRIVIEVDLKDPQAIICAGLPDFASSSQANMAVSCYQADEQGYIFAAASSTRMAVIENRYYLPDLADRLASTTPNAALGSDAMGIEDFYALQAFYDSVRRAGFKPLAILVKEGGEYELFLTVSNGENVSVVYFNNLRPFQDQLVNLASFIDRKKGEYEYIDLRYGSNVFYRDIQ